MIKLNQRGTSGVFVSLILTVVLLVAVVVFAGWAYSSRQDYKDNSDQKAAAAATAAKQQESTRKDQEFAEASKSPLKTYNGPSSSGSLIVVFPKTWSGYVDESGSNAPVDGYFNSGVVPGANDQKSVFALRVQVVGQTYADTLQTLKGQQQSGDIKVSAYALPKLPKIVGVRVKGQVDEGKTVDMIVLPLRSQTLKLWTEGSRYESDFNKYILPNFSFSP